ncbi:MAG: aromatic amino acid ammonia-lyase [Bacteroidales bacterium]|jgi:histidine ammonia-lyase|nr:aromatic amino acid ammonia-lyase [Bacteroidales bacterium]
MIIVGERYLTLDDFYQILFEEEKIDLCPNALTKVKQNHEFLEDFSKNKVIYGINTCFGPMAQYKINENDQKALQYNLIRSHATGSGQPISNLQAKALMIARLNSFMRGYSGIHPDAVHLLKDFINLDIYPKVFEHGGVGASGDLVQLAHLALNLIGEGEVWYKGQYRPAKEVFEATHLIPLKVYLREGLAIINGTSCMTGIGMINLIHAKNLLNWAVIASTIINEVVESYDDHFSKELNQVKLHEGQNLIAAEMRKIVESSRLIKKRAEYLYNGNIQAGIIKDKVQEYYSLRCVPQILGPVYETIKGVEKILINEVNSVNDNPIIDKENVDVFHGGNFHGDYISLEMDKLKIVTTKMSMLLERQLNYLYNDKQNEKFPPFVNLGTLGLNLGMQAAQFTATSTTAENQTLSNPMYIHSIPNNNDNQDIVSMGTNAALITRKVVENTFEVMAIEFISLLQIVDFMKFKDKLSVTSKKVYEEMRAIVPVFSEDAPIYPHIENIKQYLIKNRPNRIK